MRYMTLTVEFGSKRLFFSRLCGARVVAKANHAYRTNAVVLDVMDIYRDGPAHRNVQRAAMLYRCAQWPFAALQAEV